MKGEALGYSWSSSDRKVYSIKEIKQRKQSNFKEAKDRLDHLGNTEQAKPKCSGQQEVTIINAQSIESSMHRITVSHPL